MNILEIRLYNFMTWTGNTKDNPTVFKYPYVDGKSFVLFSGKVGSGKSSLAVESLLHPIFNAGREGAKFDEVLTTGEKEGYAQVFFEHHGDVYSIKYGKLFNEKSKLESVWEFKKLNQSTSEYESIYSKTPEEVLGIPFDLASKTFIIQQGEIDAFSKDDPSKKYELFANAFGIDHFYRLSELADAEVKVLNSKKEELEQNGPSAEELELINKKDDIKKEIESNKKLIISVTKERDALKKDKEQNLEKISFIDRISNYVREISIQKEKLERKPQIIEGYNNYVKVEQDKTNYEAVKIQYDQLKGSFETEKMNTHAQIATTEGQLQTFSDSKQNFINSINQKKSFFSNQLQTFIQSLGIIRTIENPSNVRKKDLIENEIQSNQFKLQELAGLIHSGNIQKKEVISQMEVYTKLFSQGVCPTCHSSITQDMVDSIKKQNEDKIKEIDIKLTEYTKSQSDLLEKNKILEIERLDSDYLDKLSKKEEIEKQLNALQPELEQKTLEFDTNIKILTDNLAYIKNSWTQRESLYTTEFNKLNYNTEYYYSLVQYLNQNKFIVDEYQVISKIDTVIGEIENNKKREVESLALLGCTFNEESELAGIRQSLEVNKQTLDSKIFMLENQINSLTYSIGSNESNISRISNLEEQNKERQEKLKQYTDKLMIYKNITYVFGKKGKPKEILEKLIPLVEKTANELLLDMSSGKYLLEFILSKETKDGRETKKNVFDINVRRVGKSLNQSYRTFSGGEKWQINFAIRMGINIIVSNLRKILLDCVIVDEGFGTQDTDETLDSILEAIKKISKRFKQFILISHVDQIKETFRDNIVFIEKQNDISRVVSM